MNDQELDEALAGFRDDVPEMTEDAFVSGRFLLETATGPVRRPLTERKARRITPWTAVAAAAAVVATVLVIDASSPRPTGPATTMVPTPPIWSTRQAYQIAPTRPAPIPGVDRGMPLPPITVPYNGAGEIPVNDLPQANGEYLHMVRKEWNQPYTWLHGAGRERPSGESVGYWEEWVPLDRGGVWQVSRDVDTRVTNEPIPQEGRLPTMVSGLSIEEGVFRAVKGDYFPATRTAYRTDGAYAASLPLDPQALYQRLARDAMASPDPAAVVVDNVGILLSRPIPTDLRKALFLALGYHPWLAISGTARTRDSRPAISLSITNQYTNHSIVLLVDANTGLLLGRREVRLVTESPTARAGTTVSETSLSWDVVGSM
nr:hypothetical protein [Kibdelosporangium sp. MJ126-NF4]CEL23333.1 hypothetical protein [Kibdelosporangium sp. MJ126-NF4]CTQ94495.1 hypothetical protein [Kibdelosporangium sp. MJ126-NF4]